MLHGNWDIQKEKATFTEKLRKVDYMTKFISYINVSSSPLACLNGSMRNVAFNDEAILSGGWFRDKGRKSKNAEKASREHNKKKQRRSKGRSFVLCLFKLPFKEEETVKVERKFTIAEKLSQMEEKN